MSLDGQVIYDFLHHFGGDFLSMNNVDAFFAYFVDSFSNIWMIQ